MNDIRRLFIAFESTFDNVDMVRAAVRRVCTDFFKLPDSAAGIMDFCLVVTELMNNAVEHAKSPVLEVELLLSRHDAIFRLMSEGVAFDPMTPSAMPTPGKDGELPEGGYGLALIQSLSNGMEYEYLGNRNTVTLRKTFSEQEQ